MSLSLIIAIFLISIILIMIPLFISKKAENEAKSLDKWEKIKDYGNKINEKTRNNKKN